MNINSGWYNLVVLDEGLEELATQFGSLITQGQWGSGTTLPTTADTGLESATTATLLSVSATTSANTVQFTHTVDSTLANGTTCTEFELRFASGDSLNRTVGASISKTVAFELTCITGVNFVRQ